MSKKKKVFCTYIVHILLLAPIWASLAFVMYLLVPRMWHVHKSVSLEPLPSTLEFLINCWTAFIERPILPLSVIAIFLIFEIFYKRAKKELIRKVLLKTFLLFSILTLCLYFVFMSVSARISHKIVDKASQSEEVINE